jgi:hypothetical protein
MDHSEMIISSAVGLLPRCDNASSYSSETNQMQEIAMPAIVETEIFTFDELSDDAQEKASEWYRQANLDYEWWDTVYSDLETICDILGIVLKTTLVTLMGGDVRRKPNSGNHGQPIVSFGFKNGALDQPGWVRCGQAGERRCFRSPRWRDRRTYRLVPWP